MRTQAVIFDNGEFAVETTSRSPVPARRSYRPTREIETPPHGITSLCGTSMISWSSSPSMTRIDCDPAAISASAMARLGRWLAVVPARHLIWLHYHDGRKPDYEMKFGRDAAEAAIRARRNRFGHNSKPLLRCISDPATIPQHMGELRKLLALWRESGNRFDRDAARCFAEANDQRLTILRPTPDKGFVVHSHGSGYGSDITRWLRANIGGPITHWPDQGYGEANERTYTELSASGHPIHDEIDCCVVWPGGKRERRRYRRLLLPCVSPTGQRYVVSSTRIDPTIDLRCPPSLTMQHAED